MLCYDANFVQSIGTLGELQRDDPKIKSSIDAYNEIGGDVTFMIHNNILFYQKRIMEIGGL